MFSYAQPITQHVSQWPGTDEKETEGRSMPTWQPQACKNPLGYQCTYFGCPDSNRVPSATASVRCVVHGDVVFVKTNVLGILQKATAWHYIAWKEELKERKSIHVGRLAVTTDSVVTVFGEFARGVGCARQNRRKAQPQLLEVPRSARQIEVSFPLIGTATSSPSTAGISLYMCSQVPVSSMVFIP